MKTCFIIRGVSGSGKSTLAKSLAAMNTDHCICEADEYFLDGKGNYNFDPSQLGAAHAYCRSVFEAAINSSVQLVICSNTNTTRKEYSFYVDKARQAGYTVHVVVVERFMDSKSIHNVPNEVLERQAEKLRQSISL